MSDDFPGKIDAADIVWQAERTGHFIARFMKEGIACPIP
jgi:hypothetical protein